MSLMSSGTEKTPPTDENGTKALFLQNSAKTVISEMRYICAVIIIDCEKPKAASQSLTMKESLSALRFCNWGGKRRNLLHFRHYVEGQQKNSGKRVTAAAQ